MITAADYNSPLGIHDGYFNGIAVPPFPDYLRDYNIHFMRYLYYLCIMNAEGEYPVEMTTEEIQNAFEKNKEKKCRPRIKKILIGEAPPPTPTPPKPNNYFYNPSPLRWNAATGNPTTGQAWTSAIKNALFPGLVFPDTTKFLIACAKEGFLLLDIFPYSIPFSGKDRKSRKYKTASIDAWGFGTAPYPRNIKGTLDYLICFIQKTISIGFALKSFGEIIISDARSSANFNAWCLANGITLNPPGPLEQIRIVPPPVAKASDYLRVCGRQNLFGPCRILLNLAGF